MKKSSAPRKWMHRRQFRLATLVTFGVCATVGLTVALQLALVDHFAINYAQKQAQLQLEQLSWQMRDSLNRVVSRTVAEVQLVSELPQVREAKSPEEARTVLESLQRTFPDYTWIGIAAMDGKVFAATQGLLEGADVGKRAWFTGGQGGLHASDYHPAVLLGKLLKRSTPDPWRFVDIAGPVKGRDGATRGVLGVHLSWDWARRRANTLLTPALREYGAEILVVRDDGVVVLGPGELLEKKLVTNSLSLAQQGGTGSVKETWPDGKVYLTGYSQTGREGENTALRWSVLVRQPEAVAMAGPHALERRTLLLSAVLGIVLAAVAALLARRRLTRPMDELSGAIESAARANDAGVPAAELPLVDGFHEAQVLSRAMRELVRSENEHRSALVSMNAQLEHTVAERTAEMRALLMRDVLTGLPNRRALMEAFPEAMQRARRIDKPCAVMFLDMDGFKGINDTYGHEEGDELLRQFGARIVEAVRKTDTVARLAGDEFVVILEMLADADDAAAKGSSLLPALQRPFELKTATVTLSASIGIAVHMPGDAHDIDRLLARADRAMYAAKRDGKNRVALETA
jgi:diguanylate cyclase (GGDEF)-like protein